MDLLTILIASKHNLSVESISFMQHRRCRPFSEIFFYIESDSLTKLLIALIGPICKKLLRAGAIADLKPATMMKKMLLLTWLLSYYDITEAFLPLFLPFVQILNIKRYRIRCEMQSK